ncbi:hypothetical protein PAXINDRAFT_182929 [Paxillus involutus ATCC 200175]|uniref:Uncharacterized protein n=1 Tax=Paxillus involutus ATCC 200175 TaxID=664439 RepID=A0A0C9SM15_PAXIN|nr:hypothetical protein PAXINDRAFT_182929 [Paxillus involutus ATCC 200175]
MAVVNSLVHSGQAAGSCVARSRGPAGVVHPSRAVRVYTKYKFVDHHLQVPGRISESFTRRENGRERLKFSVMIRVTVFLIRCSNATKYRGSKRPRCKYDNVVSSSTRRTIDQDSEPRGPNYLVPRTSKRAEISQREPHTNAPRSIVRLQRLAAACCRIRKEWNIQDSGEERPVSAEDEMAVVTVPVPYWPDAASFSKVEEVEDGA